MRSQQHPAVVVTGAAHGLGRALAKECHRRGHSLALIDVDREGLSALRSELGPDAGRVSVHCINVGDDQQVAAAAAEVASAHDGVRVLINNAAVSISQPFDRTDLAAARTLFDTNYWGYIHCTRHFLPLLQRQPQGRLVYVSSIFAHMGFPGKSVYAGSKAAIVGTTLALRAELEGTRVKVCTVIPPAMDTGLVRNGPHVGAKEREQEIRYMRDQGVEVTQVARRVIEGIERGRPRIIIGTRMKLLDLGLRVLPGPVQRMVTARARRMSFV